MRELQIKEGKLRFTEKEFKNLERYFDVERGKVDEDGDYYHGDDSLKFCDHHCDENCPIALSSMDKDGYCEHQFCMDLLDRVMGLRRDKHLTITTSSYDWEEADNRWARYYINKAAKWLKTFKKVKR